MEVLFLFDLPFIYRFSYTMYDQTNGRVQPKTRWSTKNSINPTSFGWSLIVLFLSDLSFIYRFFFNADQNERQVLVCQWYSYSYSICRSLVDYFHTFTIKPSDEFWLVNSSPFLIQFDVHLSIYYTIIWLVNDMVDRWSNRSTSLVSLRKSYFVLNV